MSIEILSIRQVKAARALLAWSQHDLARSSGVSYPTIARLEKEDGNLGGRPTTIAAIRAALEQAGVEFIAENGGGAGVRLRKVSTPSFRAFLERSEDFTFGEMDFVRDALSDTRFRAVNSWSSLRDYMADCSASDAAVERSRDVWNKYAQKFKLPYAED